MSLDYGLGTVTKITHNKQETNLQQEEHNNVSSEYQ